MTLRFILSNLLCLAAILSVKASSDVSKDENVVISDDLRIYNLILKDGKLSSVKLQSETCFEALKSNGTAIKTAVASANVSIDKASAPGTKPIYRTMESRDVFYDGTRMCLLQIPLAKGKKAKATIHQTFTSPEHFCDIFLCSGKYFTRHSTVVINVPNALAKTINITPYNFPDNISLSAETKSDGSITYTAEATDLEPWLPEEESPDTSMDAPQLVVTGQFADTKALYDYFKTFCDNPNLDDVEIGKIAAELRQKTDNPLALIDSTAAWVRHNVRYLAVEHGEYAFRPTSASETIRSRAGDCKASANLIKTLLLKNGLDGRLVWIGTQDDIPYDWDKVPALCSGNHVIAACMLPDSVIYLDGTTKWSSPGYIPYSIRGRQVIIEDGDNFIIDSVPTAGRDADTEYRSVKFSVDGNDLVGDFSMQLSGIHKMRFLSLLSHFEPRERNTVINKFISNTRKNTDIHDVNVNSDLSRQSVDVTARLREGNAARNIGDKIYIDMMPLRDIFFATVDTAGRTRDHILSFPYSISHDYEVKIPDGYKVVYIPESVAIDNDWHNACIEYTEANGMIRCHVGISTKDILTPLDKIARRNDAIKDVRRVSDSKIILSKL